MKRHHSLFPLILLATACGDADSPAAPSPLPPLADQVWHVHDSDGQTLPALLGHRVVGGQVLEQDFLDSARVVVEADGTWQHAGWYQRFHDGQFIVSGTTLDGGTWTATPSAYQFRRNSGELVYTVEAIPGTEWRINLRYPGQNGAAVSTMRRSPAPPTVAGHWRAATLHGGPLPAAYLVVPSVDLGAGPVSRHIVIDSAFVSLGSNRRYQQRVYHTEWEGPAYGDPAVRVYGATENDFGSWTTGGATIVLESGWLQNKVIRGDASGLPRGSIRLEHGIGHGDVPAPFVYVRHQPHIGGPGG